MENQSAVRYPSRLGIGIVLATLVLVVMMLSKEVFYLVFAAVSSLINPLTVQVNFLETFGK